MYKESVSVTVFCKLYIYKIILLVSEVENTYMHGMLGSYFSVPLFLNNNLHLTLFRNSGTPKLKYKSPALIIHLCNFDLIFKIWVMTAIITLQHEFLKQ